MLALLLCCKRLVVRRVVLTGCSVSVGVYRREEGEETINKSKQVHKDAWHGYMEC